MDKATLKAVTALIRADKSAANDNDENINNYLKASILAFKYMRNMDNAQLLKWAREKGLDDKTITTYWAVASDPYDFIDLVQGHDALPPAVATETVTLPADLLSENTHD